MTSRVTVIVWHFTFYTEVNGTERKKGIFTVDSLTRVITLVITKQCIYLIRRFTFVLVKIQMMSKN